MYNYTHDLSLARYRLRKLYCFSPALLALRASLVRTFWPFGPLQSWCTGLSGQFGRSKSMALFNILRRTFTEILFFLGHKSCPDKIFPRGINRPGDEFYLYL